ncbi:MAG: proline--tRNA ligase [Candidatus Omnitrophota bacterium]|nr:proline--tRNA ligase [Candidatus Omnitrophota bacterium]
MRMSKAFIQTQKEVPQGAEIPSHILMIRAGLIRKLAAGAYTYLPLGLKVLNKVEAIVREEMDRAGALEVLLPAIQPVELWEKSGRITALGEDMVSFTDRHGKKTILGPTHEEVITDLVAGEVKSYKQLPLTLYQIQTKFRDEIRPRFGVMRSREFIMKDAYSFDRDEKGLNESYKKMYDAYCRIFERCGLDYIAVEADPGIMGGNISHEFMVPSPNGEDIIAICKKCGYAASLATMDCISAMEDSGKQPAGSKKPEEVDTPGVSTIEKVSGLLKKMPRELMKTLIYKADGKPVVVLLRGDHELNEAKLKRFIGCNVLEMADAESILKLTGGPVGFTGPVGLKEMAIIADNAIKGLHDFVVGANKKDKHILNVNFEKDFRVEKWGDIRMATEQDPCPKCDAKIEVEHAIEVGHTFKLGTKYSKPMGAKFLDEDGKEKPCIMGCYGIGVNRIIATCIEKSHDKDGIIWPFSLAPYHVIILPLNTAHKETMDIAERLYAELMGLKIEVIIDDRSESAGIKFKDADLIGIPIHVVIGEKNLKNGKIELKTRKDKKTELLDPKDAVKRVQEILKR